MKGLNIRSVLFFFSTCIVLLSGKAIHAQGLKNNRLNTKAFCFYYNWHGNPKYDGSYIHWAHGVMKQNASDTTSGFIPGGDNIASNFFPSLGTYSNNDPAVIK